MESFIGTCMKDVSRSSSHQILITCFSYNSDLKPDNILISTGFKSAKLCDLGTSYRGVREIGIQKNAGYISSSLSLLTRQFELMIDYTRA